MRIIQVRMTDLLKEPETDYDFEHPVKIWADTDFDPYTTTLEYLHRQYESKEYRIVEVL